jgi:spore germination cell wall hydrolase CwlJ-like protein
MKSFISMVICILMITGGSTEAAPYGKRTHEAGMESPVAVMLSGSAVDTLLEPLTVAQGLKAVAAEVVKEQNKEVATVAVQTAVTPQPFSTAELELLARLVQAEAGGESFNGKVAVAATVLNRVRSPLYPNTISGVIYHVAYGFQYCTVRKGMINRPAGADARRAVQEALQGNDPTGGALSFYNPAKATNIWIRTRPVHARIGNHVFVG